jgi:hypothetical protein
MAREAVLTDKKSIEQIVRLRKNEGLKWEEIAARMNAGAGKCMFAFMVGTSEPMKTVNPAAIAKARSAGESWGLIAARASLPEGKVRKMFEEATGKSARGERIGKGGRPPGSTNGTAPAKKAAKATKAPAKTAAAKGGGGKLRDLVVSGQATLEQVQKGLTGKQVKVTRNGKEEVIAVSEVTGLNKNVITVKDSGTGRSRAIKAETISGVR